VQLGIFSFTKTSSSNERTPMSSNSRLNVYSIDFGLKGLGYTTKIGLTKYWGGNFYEK
jgi:hypothetical protein